MVHVEGQGELLFKLVLWVCLVVYVIIFMGLDVFVGDGCLGAREPPLLPMLLGYGEGRFTVRGLELDAACKIIS